LPYKLIFLSESCISVIIFVSNKHTEIITQQRSYVTPACESF